VYKLFSVDDHIVEPADLWSSRVPAKYRDVAPHVIVEDGREYWEWEDKRSHTMGLNAVAGKPENWVKDPVRFDEMIPGCYDAKERVRDFVSQGITSSVCFPSLPRFGGALFPSFKDKDLAVLCVQAYNDFLFDEWCAAAPNLFVPMVLVPLWDPAAAVAELERTIALGAKAVSLPEEASHLGLPSYYQDFWDPIWRLCEEAEIPVCMHIGSSGWKAYRPPEAPESLDIALGFIPTITHAVGMMFSPVPRKFPNIKLVYSEGGVSWVPAALERADDRYVRHRSWSGGDDLLPSDVCKRNMWFCMLDEKVGLAARHEIGLDRILWEVDYPHSNCPWPGTQAIVEETFAGIPDDEVAMITHRNAEALFGWHCPDVSEFDLGEPVASGAQP
jgi:predicted TIM-barrel fold metal-dependent hydrolase